jgi:hypothetical protein
LLKCLRDTTGSTGCSENQAAGFSVAAIFNAHTVVWPNMTGQILWSDPGIPSGLCFASDYLYTLKHRVSRAKIVEGLVSDVGILYGNTRTIVPYVCTTITDVGRRIPYVAWSSSPCPLMCDTIPNLWIKILNKKYVTLIPPI